MTDEPELVPGASIPAMVPTARHPGAVALGHRALRLAHDSPVPVLVVPMLATEG